MSACSGASASPLRRRQQVHDCFEDLGDVEAGLRADRNGIIGGQADGLLDHRLGALDVRAGQVDLVDDGNDLKPAGDGEIRIRQRLRLHALRCVDHQQRAFAGSQRARNFVAEVHVAGRVDQVELIGLAVLRLVHHAHGVGLDGDAALALQVHGVQHLRLHLARGERAGQLQQPVGERGLAVVDMRDDREIADVVGVHECGGGPLRESFSIIFNIHLPSCPELMCFCELSAMRAASSYNDKSPA